MTFRRSSMVNLDCFIKVVVRLTAASAICCSLCKRAISSVAFRFISIFLLRCTLRTAFSRAICCARCFIRAERSGFFDTLTSLVEWFFCCIFVLSPPRWELVNLSTDFLSRPLLRLFSSSDDSSSDEYASESSESSSESPLLLSSDEVSLSDSFFRFRLLPLLPLVFLLRLVLLPLFLFRSDWESYWITPRRAVFFCGRVDRRTLELMLVVVKFKSQIEDIEERDATMR